MGIINIGKLFAFVSTTGSFDSEVWAGSGLEIGDSKGVEEG